MAEPTSPEQHPVTDTSATDGGHFQHGQNIEETNDLELDRGGKRPYPDTLGDLGGSVNAPQRLLVR